MKSGIKKWVCLGEEERFGSPYHVQDSFLEQSNIQLKVSTVLSLRNLLWKEVCAEPRLLDLSVCISPANLEES